MKKACFVLAALSAILLVAPAQAEVENAPDASNSYVSASGGAPRPSLVQPHRAFPANGELDPVMRPPSVDPTATDPGDTTRSSASKAGPTATSTGFSAGGGSLRSTGALLTPRGGAMSTPRQQAARAVQRVIRRLD